MSNMSNGVKYYGKIMRSQGCGHPDVLRLRPVGAVLRMPVTLVEMTWVNSAYVFYKTLGRDISKSAHLHFPLR